MTRPAPARMPGPISDECKNMPSLRPQRLGRYTLRVTVDGCTGPELKPFLFYSKSSAYDLGGGQYVNAFPNPVVGRPKVYFSVDSQAGWCAA